MTLFIYGLFDPREQEKIRYVGLTENLGNRMASHRNGKERTTKAWVKELAQSGFPLAFRIIEESDDLNGPMRERFWIAHYHAILPLLNGKTDFNVSEFEFRVSPITTLRDMEGKYLRWTLDYFDGNKLVAAKALGIGRQTLYNKLKAYGMES